MYIQYIRLGVWKVFVKFGVSHYVIYYINVKTEVGIG